MRSATGVPSAVSVPVMVTSRPTDVVGERRWR